MDLCYKSERRKAQLVRKSKRHLRMLKYVIEIDLLDSILSGVYNLEGIFKSRLNNKGTGITSFGSRGMVRAGIATFSFHEWHIAVLFLFISFNFACIS